MKLVVEFIKNEIDELHQNGVRVQTIGDLSRFPEEPKKKLYFGLWKKLKITLE